MTEPMLRRLGVAIGLLGALGCAEPRDGRIEAEQIWDQPVEQVEVQEPIDFRECTRDDPDDLSTPDPANSCYQLPADQPSIAELIALMPSEGVSRSDANMWVSDSVQFPTSVCQGGGPEAIDGLPITFEAVVALHPRQYVKVPICDQDERNYGTFVITDDTGGIAVLRNARVADFTFGDHVRVTVNGLMQAYGDPGARYIILGEFEPLPAPVDEEGQPIRTVFYDTQAEADGPFETEDIGHVRRIEGWVVVAPTNDNFNDLVIASEPVAPTAGTDVDGVCVELCRTQCKTRCPSSDNAVCVQMVCPVACQGQGAEFVLDEVPVCWAVNVDMELGRRGFSAAFGSHVAVTGPVVRGFGRQNIWMSRLGQFEALDVQGETE